MNTHTIRTRSRVYVDLLDPNPGVVRVEDIGHALAGLGRYTGHCWPWYSVGEHSSIIARELLRRGEPVEVALWGLLHDGGEAYTGDWSRPLKAAIRALAHLIDAGPYADGYEAGYRTGYEAAIDDVLDIEKRWQAAIVERYGLPRNEPEIVKKLDTELGAWERHIVMGSDHPGAHWAAGEIQCLAPKAARAEFMALFAELTG